METKYLLLSEMIARKEHLQIKIKELINDFQDETKLYVQSIDITNTNVDALSSNTPRYIVTKIELDIKL